MREEVNYKSEFTQRLIDRVKEVKAGGKNPALNIEDPISRKDAAFALKQSRLSDQHQVRTALKALEGGAKDIANYIETGNPNPGLMSRSDVSGRESREMLLKKLITHKGKL